jgi:uncharacterized spore protein YtfJ
MSEDEARVEARKQIEQGDFLSRIADRVGSSARVSAVFGEPVERDGLTVVPVARVSWGFGGGSGGEGEDEGHGGGGGAMATPHGFIEISGDKARYRPIRSRTTGAVGSLLVLAAAGAAAAVVLRAR